MQLSIAVGSRVRLQGKKRRGSVAAIADGAKGRLAFVVWDGEDCERAYMLDALVSLRDRESRKSVVVERRNDGRANGVLRERRSGGVLQ